MALEQFYLFAAFFALGLCAGGLYPVNALLRKIFDLPALDFVFDLAYVGAVFAAFALLTQALNYGQTVWHAVLGTILGTAAALKTQGFLLKFIRKTVKRLIGRAPKNARRASKAPPNGKNPL